MAKEYIEKEAFCLMLYNRGMRLLDEDKEPVLAGTLHAVEKMAHDFPAADVRENVVGEWKKMDMHRGMENYKCSVCRSECYVPEMMGEPMFPLCPYCGAQMMGGAEDGE